MSLLDEFVGSTNLFVINLEHGGGGAGDVVIKAIVILPFDFFQSVLQPKGNELVDLIYSIEFRGGKIF